MKTNCPSCNEPLAITEKSRFCEYCGTSLGDLPRTVELKAKQHQIYRNELDAFISFFMCGLLFSLFIVGARLVSWLGHEPPRLSVESLVGNWLILLIVLWLAIILNLRKKLSRNRGLRAQLGETSHYSLGKMLRMGA